ncbi:sensor histidine kinase [Lentzea flaviverrucosa]|uniref:histidine kinase n=1 Tax=Lentzea flaviverrucosa TaxID=200379 RepID=A0A1H9AF10_9PSEU|nr:HAMP domain-containing sensor histidine kinase [Lentzea flaviverrucosa]RDI32098.1 phospho-acceptor domain-containing protein [Lentzea flaviverrucosa]SEP74538.1 His Kinase A (phospho-acceptor) domain-containing protein [Lentzea flaviverrucosa]
MRSWAEAERAEVRRARLRVSVLVGLAITLMIAFVGAIAYVVIAHAQETQVSRELRYNALYGVPGIAPRCAWVFVLEDGVLHEGDLQVPGGFPLRDDIDAVHSSGTALPRDVTANGTQYRVLTAPGADGTTVQAVFDMRYQLADRAHLLQALVIALVCGLLVAALIGLGISRRTVGPLAEALARQRRFVTDASHELRTPIARAYLRAQLLASHLPADQRTDLDALARSIRGLADVVDDLLASAQLPQRLDGRPVDLADVAEAAVVGETERAAERRITLALDHPGHPVVVHGIETGLRRAVDELLANAVRHTPEGGRISVAVRVGGGMAELVVSDDGEGFEAGEAERLFARFHRGAGEGRFGLGLALVREIVTGHGGTVEAVGRPGLGARFTLRIPVVGQVGVTAGQQSGGSVAAVV